MILVSAGNGDDEPTFCWEPTKPVAWGRPTGTPLQMAGSLVHGVNIPPPPVSPGVTGAACLCHLAQDPWSCGLLEKEGMVHVTRGDPVPSQKKLWGLGREGRHMSWLQFPGLAGVPLEAPTQGRWL